MAENTPRSRTPGPARTPRRTKTNPEPLVFIASPWSGGGRLRTVYLRKAIFDSFGRGEHPIAPHAIYTRYLNDKVTDQRELGMNCGFNLLLRCDIAAFYTDYGFSEGMSKELDFAVNHKIPVEVRLILGRGAKTNANRQDP